MTVAVFIAYSPHAFTHLMQIDPAHTLEKALELLLYVVVGSVTGLLVDRERERQHELHGAMDKLKLSLEEQKQMADQLIRAGRLAALGELVAGIAHEIKNPLHALKGTAEVVDTIVAKDQPQSRMWDLHLKEIDRIEKVAERFLSFARPNPLQRKELQLLEVVSRTTALIEAQACKQKASLIIDDDPGGEKYRSFADEQQLTQVLLNISINALQAIGETHGTIRYALASNQAGETRYHLISIQNDGPPIPEADVERIFDPFVTTKSDGVGLGLSIASRIVEQHGGFIKVQNLDEAKGVVFYINIPAG